MIFLILRYTPLKFNNSYVYPWWAYFIGWFLAFSSLVQIPIAMVFKLAQQEGTLWQVSGVWLWASFFLTLFAVKTLQNYCWFMIAHVKKYVIY